MSSEINPGQFGSRMCREQLRSEQVLPEASRADRLAYDPERNTLQVSRREKRTSWGAWPAVQRRSSEGAGMTGQRGRLEKLMPDKTGLSDVMVSLRASPPPGARGGARASPGRIHAHRGAGDCG